ncbi:putative LPS assembly protein LptD [Chitinophagaceae bacterium LB-8]|uniref:LPS assembly protein LptD n=1 Tax=Paraflavisolibacter caeni TaxID=2982496 RepID=A0A9X2XVR3_9BACT|nr:putative LPS assembly protein LptD [Paraflavisolibacter caeni]MCU7550264.1 putative LPS assembly protein LptD [Paraflavisolibacter caeni]
MHKFRSKKIFSGIVIVTFCSALTWKGEAHPVSGWEFYSLLTKRQDTIPKPNRDSSKKKPSLPLFRDSSSNRNIISETDTVPNRDTTPGNVRVDTFSFKISKDTLEAPVNYEAEDSAVIQVPEKRVLLYGKTKTTYKDVTLTAPVVALDQETHILTAIADRDSLGDVLNRAHFEQGTNVFDSDTIAFNFKSQRGITRNTFTQQEEMFIQGEKIKKIDDKTVFISRGRFTTCNLDEPHFAFRTNKLKVINKKIAVSGPTHPEFEGVPVPVYLPFGFFPLSSGRHSGFLPPQYTTNEDFGVGLEGVGYYKVLNDNFDVTLRGNIYSYGGWSATLTPTYRVRYRYNGSMNFSLQHTKFNFKGDPDYNLVKTFQINWSHSVDQRARPGTSFSANVNAGSTKYNQYVANNPYKNFQNQLSSSIAYSKNWAGKPYNLTLSANHNQNNNTRLINLTLPDAGFTVNTLYPLQRQELVGTPKWYEKLGIGYSGSFRNQISFYDSLFSFDHLLDTMQWGASHRIPITLSLPPMGPLLISPSVSYEEVWLQKQSHLKWNDVTKKLDTSYSKGLFTDRQMSFGLGFNTSLFGTFQFRNSRLAALRHVMRPTFSINYRPDLSKHHYYKVIVDSTGRELEFSEFAGNLMGSGFSKGQYGGISFGIDNNLEMKWRSKKDTGENAIKKVRLIDGFGFNSGYNFLADSLKLQNFNLYLRSTLFEKINLTASALYSPYKTDQYGRPINQFAWEGPGFNLGQITYGSISMSTSFQSKTKDEKEGKTKQEQPDAADLNRITDPNLVADQQQLMDYMRRNPAEFVDFNVPWQISLSFALGFNRRPKSDYSGFETELNSNLSFSNSFSLTPKWNFSTNGYFDVITKKLQTFTMSINREMHCWQMSIGVTPVGVYRSFNFTISPKSGILQDLKINRSRYFYNY